MTATALTLLAVLAVVPVVLGRFTRTAPPWRTIALAAGMIVVLGVAAVFALGTDRVTGVPAVITYFLVALVAVTGGTAMVRGALVTGGIPPWRSPGDGSEDVAGDDAESVGADRARTPPPAGTPPAADAATSPDERRDPSIAPLRGGRVIGYLERLVVVGALATHWPEAIAIAMAVKGLGRYPELREPGAAEQFIIGTFASVIWAAAAAGVGQILVR
ncbi:hypothetical protein [Gordonia soli]|uniref:Uncharacterized protein n=1 Tax=Gordonia soli NBRC 108243 TaxID=1223545 RepID=M0QKA7_9ACTN|nr:hypothetical protein [Gordonia soli]GAC68726.1 hypothetical protein GS4_18_00140 [Gordonia soli NBRC 108243]